MTTRRDFLRDSTLLAGAAVLGAARPTSARPTALIKRVEETR